VVAWAGFLLLPFTFMVCLGSLYARYGDVDVLRRFLSGIAVAASGLLVATAAKMATPLLKSFGPASVVWLATAAAIGVMRWPLLLVMLVLVPLSIGLSAVRRS
jgi:chromate transporter